MKSDTPIIYRSWPPCLLSVLVGCSIAMGSCKTVTKTYQPPVVTTDSLFRDSVHLTDTGSLARFHWRDIYTDPKLQKLIKTAIDNNFNLKIAYSRVRQAADYYEQSRLNFYPDLNAAASAQVGDTRSNTTNVKSNVHTYQLGLTSSWEADLWGKLKNTREANLASMLSVEANARAVQTQLVASVANSYYALMAYDWQLKIMQQTLATWKRTVEVMKILKTGDVVTGAAVVQSQASMYAAEASIPDIQRLQRETENEICNLMGVPSGSVERDSLFDDYPLPAIRIGVPAELLSHRPDVTAAENSFRQTWALTNVARTKFYPSFSITANGALNNNNFASFFSAGSLIGSLLGNLTQPIFNKGQNKLNLKVAEEQQQQAFWTFQQTVLQAGQEVSNALYAYQAATEKFLPRSRQLENLNKSVDYTQKLVRNGVANSNYSEVLLAMQNLLSAELSQVNDYLQKWQALTNLYAALGGGWE